MIKEADLSLDKITVLLKSTCTSDKGIEIASLCPLPYKSVKDWQSSKIGTYRFNMVCQKTADGGAVYVGLGFNGVRLDESRGCAIEYNPNKVDDPYVFFATFAEKKIFVVGIRKCDLAIDLPYVPSQCDIVLNNRRCDLMYYGTENNMTRYISPKGEYRLKIYDKGKEQNVNKAWTRVEMTVKNLDLDPWYNEEHFVSIASRFNEVYVPTELPLEINDRGLNRCICYLLGQAGEDVKKQALSLMDRKTRLRYDEFLRDHNSKRSLNVDPKEIYDFLQKEFQIIKCYRKKEFNKKNEALYCK